MFQYSPDIAASEGIHVNRMQRLLLEEFQADIIAVSTRGGSHAESCNNLIIHQCIERTNNKAALVCYGYGWKLVAKRFACTGSHPC